MSKAPDLSRSYPIKAKSLRRERGSERKPGRDRGPTRDDGDALPHVEERSVVLANARPVLEDHTVADPDVFVDDRLLDDAPLADPEAWTRHGALVARRPEDDA